MAESYGNLLCEARKHHNPPMSAKELANKLEVKPPFITDLEKGRRLPSLDTQKKIKKLLACEKYPDYLFDDLAANNNHDIRIVAEDLSHAIRKKAALRKLIRIIVKKKLTSKAIETLAANIGETNYDIE
ncbi:MAG: helix-turn-helix transcriptional regulator [Oscillospiraceae bacterium]|nr:helix-turn-helix transcriptional regulator [Oscillospiraceae bacterium]